MISEKMKEFILSDLYALPEAATWIIQQSKGYKLFAFRGEMGAGKTTLIKEICQQLGAIDVVNSPTFALINEYHTENDEELYHFDFYRIESREEALDFGYEEYVYSGSYCFIEWPEKIEELLPDDMLNIDILVNQDGSRSLKIRT